MFNLLAIMLLAALSLVAAEPYSCTFTPTGWNKNDWTLVKSPRWSNRGSWIQEADHIRNTIPADATPEQLMGARAAETFVSMVRKQPVTGNCTFKATMSFEHRMAPELILAASLGAAEDGYPEYREYWEIVLFDEGINVWHHEIKDGKPFWRKAAYVKTDIFKPGKPYTMTASVVFTAKCPQLTVSCEGVTFGTMLPTLPKTYSIGLTACEGTNRFFNFESK